MKPQRHASQIAQSKPDHDSEARGWIVVTTINPPTPAVRRLADLRALGWSIVVVGDSKTPTDWQLEGVHYLSLADQAELFGKLSERIPLAHYSRKNLGYLYALEHGADHILETDDDNDPYPGFSGGISRTVRGRLLRKDGWVNVYRHFTEAHIWPRGLPLSEIWETGTIVGTRTVDCLVQQYLADEDPDVDAIYRLVIRRPCTFDPSAPPLILEPECRSPFNSQNTLFFREAFPLLYLPSHVSFRITDIWRSLVAQEVLWSHGHQVAFHTATVAQRRNAHELMDDFRQEIDGYTRNAELAQILSRFRHSRARGLNMSQTARAMWEELIGSDVIPDSERDILDSWFEYVDEAEGKRASSEAQLSAE